MQATSARGEINLTPPPTIPPHPLFDKSRKFLKMLKKISCADIQKEEETLRLYLKACSSNSRASNLMAFEYQLLRLAKDVRGMYALAEHDRNKVLGTIARLKTAIDEKRNEEMIRRGWKVAKVDLRHICHPGSIVYLHLWENMKNGMIAVEDPTRVSTDLGPWVRKMYRALVHHQDVEGFQFFLFMTKEGKGIESVLNVDPLMYVRVYRDGTKHPLHDPRERHPAIAIRAPGEYEVHGKSFLHLASRWMPFQNALLWPTGAQLSKRDRKEMDIILKKIDAAKSALFRNSKELNQIKDNQNKWVSEPYQGLRTTYTNADLPDELLAPGLKMLSEAPSDETQPEVDEEDDEDDEVEGDGVDEKQEGFPRPFENVQDFNNWHPERQLAHIRGLPKDVAIDYLWAELQRKTALSTVPESATVSATTKDTETLTDARPDTQAGGQQQKASDPEHPGPEAPAAEDLDRSSGSAFPVETLSKSAKRKKSKMAAAIKQIGLPIFSRRQGPRSSQASQHAPESMFSAKGITKPDKKSEHEGVSENAPAPMQQKTTSEQDDVTAKPPHLQKQDVLESFDDRMRKLTDLFAAW